MRSNDLLDRYCLMMARQLKARSESPGYDVWPAPIVHPAEANEYLYVPFFVKLHSFIEKLEAIGYSEAETANLFLAPSRAAHITYLFPGLPFTNLSEQERVHLSLKLLRYIAHLRADPLCENGTNVIWAENEVRERLESLRILKPNETDKKVKETLGKLNAILFVYTELLYFCHHSIGHEFHGPYKIGANGVLLVREFFDLKPEFWQFTRDLSFDKVTLMTKYHPRVHMSIDFTGRLVTSQILPKNLLEFSITIDDKNDVTSLDELQEILQNLKEIVDRGIEVEQDLSKKQLITKYAEAYFHILKPLAQRTGESETPPNELYERIEQGQTYGVLRPEIFKDIGKLPDEEQITVLARIFDPRQSFNSEISKL